MATAEIPYGWELEKLISKALPGDYDPEGNPFPAPGNALYCLMRPVYRDMWQYVQIQVPKKLNKTESTNYLLDELRDIVERV